MNAIKTTHNLDFEAMPWERDPSYMRFRVGTVHGLWSSHPFFYQITAIINDKPGNGHLEDMFQWFIHSCKRDCKELIIAEFFNDRFKKHCIEKRGFKEMASNHNNVIKVF